MCLLCAVSGGILTLPSASRAAEAVAVTPKPCAPGQAVTLKWYFTGVKVLVAGGRFGKGIDVTGRTTLTDTPQKTTRYTFDVWYPDPKSAATPKALLHTQYTATAEISEIAKVPTEEQIATQLLELVNKERTANNLPPLRLHPQLQAAAHWMAQDMATNDYLDHTDHEGREIEARLTAFEYKDYQAIGENVAAGQATAADVMASWMQSPGHRSNILSPDFCEVGIGHASGSTGKFQHYWVQAFGRQQDSFPVIINSGAMRTARPEVKLYLYGEGTMKQMRFSNDGIVWTAWEPYLPNRDWMLSAGSGKHTVYVELTDGKRIYHDSANIDLVAEKTPSVPPVAHK
ncbi:MAG: SCP-like extracellular [Chthonomonadaceae bacterium]|nr:SCP-like extracellular [Chthonomonadaceae bacterium]